MSGYDWSLDLWLRFRTFLDKDLLGALTVGAFDGRPIKRPGLHSVKGLHTK